MNDNFNEFVYWWKRRNNKKYVPSKKLFDLEFPGLNKIITDLNKISIIFLNYSEMRYIIKNLQEKINN